MTKIKTADLIGPALDWVVAKCEGEDYSPATTYSGIGHEFPPTNYSTNWAQAGPIIEREGITLVHMGDDWRDSWKARMGDGHWQGHEITGPAALIAAMRCFVASRLGDEVDVPDELTGD